MKKGFSISIPEPCAARWDNFTPTAKGGFCSACSKIVVDFTKKGDDEIEDFFKHKPVHCCGRFRPDQVKGYAALAPLKINTGLTLLKASFLSLLLVFMSKQAPAQNTTPKTKTETVQYPIYAEKGNTTAKADQIIRGVVNMGDDQPLAGVSVYLKGSMDGTATDINGRFEFPYKLKAGDTLVFNFIGFETKEYAIPGKINEEITISMTESYIALMGAVAIVDDESATHQFSLRRWWVKVKAKF